MGTTLRRVVVPGVPVNRLVTVREERAAAVAPSPLPMRAVPGAPAAALTFRQRVARVVTTRARATAPQPRGPVRVTGAQARRARQLELPPLSQRDLAARLDCSRSAIAEAERGVRPALPNVAQWVEDTLRRHGEWEAPEGAPTP